MAGSSPLRGEQKDKVSGSKPGPPHLTEVGICSLNFVLNCKKFNYRNKNIRIHKPVSMSLALEEAEPIGFVAVQEYWPARLLSVLKILRVAILSKNDV
jgi:hypothetical protein